MPPRFLHVANGTCTTQLIAAASIPGTVSIWADPLYEGPVPGALTDDQLVDVRARFLAGADDRLFSEIATDLRQWRQVIADSGSYDELVLWFEHDLFDQLNLIQILRWMSDRLPETTVVSLIGLGAFRGRPGFKGLGELSVGELAPLFNIRQRIGAAEIALARRAWRAFGEPSPQTLDDLRHSDTSALPFLSAALKRFLQEFPWRQDGLSRSERRLLQLASDGGVGLRDAFPRMHEGEAAYYITDRSLAALVDGLAHTTPPLLIHDSPAASGAAVLHGSVTTTDTGAAVLQRRLDRVEMCGVDRWLGGVHLQNGANLWRWDDDAGHCSLQD